MERREEVLKVLADGIPHPEGRPVLVAIDGADASGKSTLRRELALLLSRDGRDVVEASMDNFHHPRDRRYRQGRDSGIGYWEDAFDRGAFIRKVIEPLTEGGSRMVTLQHHDLRTDEPVDDPVMVHVDDEVVLLADGLFMQHPDLADYWDAVIYVDVPYSVRFERLVDRDGIPNDPEDPAHLRYYEAQLLYRSTVSPRAQASIVIENSEPARPRLISA